MLGIDIMGALYYEGEGMRGYGLWPAPVVTMGRVLSRGALATPDSVVVQLVDAKVVFREDSFDPVSRVRRGRFYRRTPEGINNWLVQPHPAFREEVGFTPDYSGFLKKQLCSFNSWLITQDEGIGKGSIVVLGTGVAVSSWRIVDVERITTTEDLVTLKASSRMGVLPELTNAELPVGAAERIASSYDKAADAAHRLGPESVIDRCRDSAAVLLGSWLAQVAPDASQAHLDLAKAGSAVHAQGKRVAGSAGQLLALLHARGKPSEQAKRGVRAPTEADSAVALECLSLIARELGYASE
jgi:hypothetical protein